MRSGSFVGGASDEGESSMLELLWGRHIHMSLLATTHICLSPGSECDSCCDELKADMTLITVYIIILIVF